MKQAVSRFEEGKVIARLRRAPESLTEALHVSAPDPVRRNVNQKLKWQRFLVVEVVHVRRRNFVGRAPAEIFPDPTTQFPCLPIEIQTLVAIGWGSAKHRREGDVSH